MMPILVKTDDVGNGRKVKARHGRLQSAPESKGYVGTIQSFLLDHTKHFQLAFYQPSLGLIDVKIILLFGKGLKFC